MAKGESARGTLRPDIDVKNIGEWFTGLLASSPAAYSKISGFLQEMMPDFAEVKNPVVGKETRNLILRFLKGSEPVEFELDELSDG